jgi:hypothetical protein
MFPWKRIEILAVYVAIIPVVREPIDQIQKALQCIPFKLRFKSIDLSSLLKLLKGWSSNNNFKSPMEIDQGNADVEIA